MQQILTINVKKQRKTVFKQMIFNGIEKTSIAEIVLYKIN